MHCMIEAVQILRIEFYEIGTCWKRMTGTIDAQHLAEQKHGPRNDEDME